MIKDKKKLIDSIQVIRTSGGEKLIITLLKKEKILYLLSRSNLL